MSGGRKGGLPRLLLWGALVTAVLLGALFIGLLLHTRGVLLSQQAAERWRGENRTDFAQVSCFVPVDEKLTLVQVHSFRQEILRRLESAAMDASDGERLWVDAWSTQGKVLVATELGRGEARVVAVGGEFFLFHPLRLLNGNYITASDLMQDRVLLDEELAWLLFGGTQLQGLELRLNGVPFVVGGVIEREQDRFSRRAYTAGMGLFMSWDAWSLLQENAGIDCYEYVMAEPVHGAAVALAREKFPIGRGEILQNTDRFTVSRLTAVLRSYGSRSMQTQGIIYPYWENAARSAEDAAALYLLLGSLVLLTPATALFVTLFRLLRSGKRKLTGEILPGVAERAEEAVRVRRRRAWERRRGKHEKY